MGAVSTRPSRRVHASRVTICAKSEHHSVFLHHSPSTCGRRGGGAEPATAGPTPAPAEPVPVTSSAVLSAAAWAEDAVADAGPGSTRRSGVGGSKTCVGLRFRGAGEGWGAERDATHGTAGQHRGVQDHPYESSACDAKPHSRHRPPSGVGRAAHPPWWGPRHHRSHPASGGFHRLRMPGRLRTQRLPIPPR